MNSGSGTEQLVEWGMAWRTEQGTLAFATNIPSGSGLVHLDDEIPLADALKPGALGHQKLRLETDDPLKVDINAPIRILGPHPLT